MTDNKKEFYQKKYKYNDTDKKTKLLNTILKNIEEGCVCNFPNLCLLGKCKTCEYYMIDYLNVKKIIKNLKENK